MCFAMCFATVPQIVEALNRGLTRTDVIGVIEGPHEIEAARGV